jgi:hypothetical protein
MALTEQERAERNQAAAEYVTIRSEWRGYFQKWNVVYYVLGLLLLLFSIAASAKQVGISDYWASIFSLIVVVLAAVIGFLKPEEKASRYRQAWSLLQNQLARFLFDETYTLNDVIRACEQGESIIHQTPAAPQPPQAPAVPAPPPQVLAAPPPPPEVPAAQ